MPAMNINQASRQSGLPVKTIRYYEDIGLVAPGRAENCYRSFGPDDLRRLGFLGRARALGFSLQACRDLLALQDDAARSSAEVKEVAARHLAEIDDKLRQLRQMRGEVAALLNACAGDARPDCAILTELARGSARPDECADHAASATSDRRGSLPRPAG